MSAARFWDLLDQDGRDALTGRADLSEPPWSDVVEKALTEEPGPDEPVPCTLEQEHEFTDHRGPVRVVVRSLWTCKSRGRRWNGRQKRYPSPCKRWARVSGHRISITLSEPMPLLG